MKPSSIIHEEELIWQLLHEISDPEIPVLSVTDLGIIRDVSVNTSHAVHILITPTYSGCPAMDLIAMNIRMSLLAHGYTDIKITSVLDPAWSTDWISAEGKQKLKQYGIAPPAAKKTSSTLFAPDDKIPCPNCGSSDTKLLSEFGSTSCKALYQCGTCSEPFDYFKCH